MRKFRGAPKEIEKKTKNTRETHRKSHAAGSILPEECEGRLKKGKTATARKSEGRRTLRPLCVCRGRGARRISEATGRRILPIPVKWRRLVRLQAVLPFKLFFPKRFVAWAVSPILGASARRRARRGVEAFLRERTMRWRIRPGLILKSSAMGPKGAFSLARFVFFLGGAGLVGIGRIGPGRRLRPKRAHRIALESGDEGASTLAGAAHFFPAPFVARNVLFILVAFWLFNVLGLIQESARTVPLFGSFLGILLGRKVFRLGACVRDPGTAGVFSSLPQAALFPSAALIRDSNSLKSKFIFRNAIFL